MRGPFRKVCSAFFPVLLAVIISIGPGRASARESDAAQRKIDRLQRSIEKERDRLIRAREREQSIFSELRSLDSLVFLQRSKEKAIKKKMADLESKMDQARLEEKRIEEVLEVQRKKLGKRFRAMYMDGPSGLMELVLTADSFADLSRREKYYKALARADGKLIEEYRGNIKVLRDVQKKLAREREKLRTLKGAVENTRRELEKERSNKTALLKAAREDLDTHLKVIKELKSASRRLGGVIARHEKKIEKRKAEEEAKRRPRLSAKRKALLEAAKATPERSAQILADLPPLEPPPERREGGFAQQRGAMCAPVRGRVVQSYGTQRNPRFGTQTYSKGIALSASYGAPIKAVYDGEVVYTGWFGGYGKIIIVSHGDHFYTMYGHASSISRGTGSKVKRGEVIARAGDTGSLEGTRVYFEVRKGSSSMSPLGWVRVGC